MLEGLSGSSGRGLHGEKRRELGRPWKFLGVRSAHSTSRQASRSPEEGADGVMQPAQETLSGHAGLEQTMPTSLQGRAKKAAHEKSYRFRNFFGMLTVAYVLSGWSLLNKRAASGVDRISARAYGSRLHDHVTSLVERVKNQCYRAKLVRRHSIPKGNGALRPLGIPATEDTLLQMAGARILEAIYEPDFLPRSYGYRKKIGARDAVRDLTRHLQFGPYSYVVEADIKGSFDPAS